MSILERLLYKHGNAAKMSDQQDAGEASEEANGHGKPDLLPLGDSNEARKPCSVLVSVTGDPLDHQLIALACRVAEEKHTKLIHVIYGIEVPRSKPLNEDMPHEHDEAQRVLHEAETDAKQCHVTAEGEWVHARNVGESLVDAAVKHNASLLIIGVPYGASTAGQFELSETVDYVLKNAPCRVWVIRGEAPESGAQSPSRSDQRQAAATHS